MKYKYFHILFLALLISLGGITFSDTVGDSDEVSDIWLSQEGDIENFLPLETDGLQWEIYDLVASKEHLSSMETVLQESEQDIQNDKDEMRKNLQKIEDMQLGIEQSIEREMKEKSRLEEEILFLEQEAIHLKKRQEEMKKYLRKVFVENYVTQMEEKHMSLIGILVERTFDAQIGKIDTLNSIEGNMDQLIEKQQWIEASLRQTQQEIEKRKKTKERVLSGLTSYQEELQDTKTTQKEVLSETLKKESLQKKLAKIQTKKQVIEEKIEEKFADYEKSIQEKKKTYACDTGGTNTICKWIRGYIRAEKTLLSEENASLVKWEWPLLPKLGFWYHFRDQKYFINNNTHHEWLDILVDTWSPIKAIGKWYILMKQYPKDGFPGMVAIKHPGNFISVYLGVAPTSLATFSRINAGDTIAVSRDYMDHSGKNNVHLVMYENGKTTDPLEKLNLSSLDAGIIPSRYGWKYIDDLKRVWINLNVPGLQKKIGFFYVPGENEFDRQKEFLKTYASKDFQAYDPWIEESIAEGIDPTFVLCVGFAESTLGNNLTTNGNIGNVWNTDDGDRQSYENSRSWVRAISSVVNNSWLGGYTTIDELSGWWNTTGPIYASSQTNWHENIVKCMSALKGRYVWNSAKFRLTKAGLYIYKQQGFIPQESVQNTNAEISK